MKRILLSFIVSASFLAPVAAQAQDAWLRQVRTQLTAAGRVFEDRGYELTHRIYTGSLRDNETEMVQLDLDVGMEYQIMGACDADCSDLDLTLYDGNGNVVDRDVLDDDVPVVSVTVRRSGAFRLRVSMVSCSQEPCRYGIGVFGK